MLRRFVLPAIVLAGAAFYLATLAQSARAADLAPRVHCPPLHTLTPG